MAFQIKPMETEAEMLGKARVHWNSWQDTYAGLIPASYLEKLTLEKCTEIARRWPDNILVAKDGETVVGFAGFGISRDEDLPDTGELFALYVLKEYQRQGVGSALTREVFSRLADFQKIALWVLKGNERAVRFYEKTGFRFDGTEKELTLGEPRTEQRMVYVRKDS